MNRFTFDHRPLCLRLVSSIAKVLGCASVLGLGPSVPYSNASPRPEPPAKASAITPAPIQVFPEQPSRELIQRAEEQSASTNDEAAVAALNALVTWTSSPQLDVARWAAEARVRHLERTSVALRQMGAGLFTKHADLTEVVLNGCPVRDDDLRWLRGWPLLTDISLERTPVTDAGIRHLVGLPKLEWLNLYRTQIGDDSLLHLGTLPRLKHLPVGETRVTDDGLAGLKNRRGLEYLGLKGTAITDRGLEILQDCDQLRGLHLGSTQITEAGLHHIATLKGLRRLWLDGIPISDSSILGFARLPDLEELHLANTRLTPKGFEQLRAMLPQCRIQP